MVKVMINKVKLSVLLMLCMNLICGCGSKELDYQVDNEELSKDYYSVKNDYDFKNAKKDGYVVYELDKVFNEDNILKFYENYKNNINDDLTIVKYTIEGDPMVIQYVYRDNKLIVYEDYTRDDYGSSDEISVKLIKEIELDRDDNNHIMIVEKYL